MLASRFLTKRLIPRPGFSPASVISARVRPIQTQNALGVACMATITQAITDDHRHIQDCYNEVVNSSDPDHQQRWGNQFTWELARHSVGEELILYPAFEWHMGTVGSQIAETDRKDHHQVQLHLQAVAELLLTP